MVVVKCVVNLLVVLGLVLGAYDAKAQMPVADTTRKLDRAEGIRDGRSAALRLPIRRHYVIGVLGGIPIGFAGPFAVGEGDAIHLIPVSVGLGTIGVALQRRRAPSETIRREASQRGPAYERGFVEGFAAEETSSRRKAVLTGSAVGGALGVVLLYAAIALFTGST